MFQLCLELGYPHPDYLLEELDSRQLQEWCEWYKYRPFGHEIMLQMMAQQSSIAASAGGAKGVTPETFVPWEVEKQEYDAEKMMNSPAGQAAGIVLKEIEEQREYERGRRSES